LSLWKPYKIKYDINLIYIH